MKRLSIAVSVIACLLAVGTWVWAQSLRSELRDERVAFANQLAAKDQEITRLAVLSDSQVAVTRRLAFQLEEGKINLRAARTAYGDMLDSVEVLGVALAEFQIWGDSLEAVLVGKDATIDSMGTVRAEGHLDARDSLGLEVGAEVTIPRSLEAPTWTWSVAREPLSLSLGLQCEGPMAAAYITGPPWASIAIDSVAQQAGICNPLPPRWQPFELKLPSIPVTGALLVIGYFLGSKE